MRDQQITFAPHGHILTNHGVWSPDGRRIVYDIRSDADGSLFDGDRIETVDVETGHVRTIYTSTGGACCGVASFDPSSDRVVFILGPDDPARDGFTYAAARRRGVMVDTQQPGIAIALDARDLSPPYTPGALRGGTHVHQFSPDGRLVSFTYEDLVLSRFSEPGNDHDLNQRNVGVSALGSGVRTPQSHPRNHDGSAFSVLVSRTTARPNAGSDQYSRAYEEGWVGVAGYRRADGSSQRYALAFLGDVVADSGVPHTEVFLADLPEDLTQSGNGPLAGTETRMPWPPAGVAVRRLTYTAGRKWPGVSGVRHWVRSSPDGSRMAFLMRDDAGVSQLWTVLPVGGDPVQLSCNEHAVGSAFSWRPDGSAIAYAMDGSICLTSIADGTTTRLTPRPADPADAPLPLACVFSPDGGRIAYQRRVLHSDGRRYNQLFVLHLN